MNIAHAMCFVIQRAKSLGELLESAVELIATEMGTDVCSIYLLDPADHKLRLMATRGLDRAALGKVSLALGEGLTGTVVQEMRSLAVEDASSHPGFRYFPETKEEQFHSYLGVPMAIRTRPVGAIVVQTREQRSYAESEIEALSTIAAQLVGVVENARLIDSMERGDEGRQYIEEIRAWRSSGQLIRESTKSVMDRVLDGTVASPGLTIGAALFCAAYEHLSDPAPREHRGVEAECARVAGAFEKTRQDVLRIRETAEREAGEEHAMIFSSHLLLLNDPLLHEKIEARLHSGESAWSAIHAELEQFSRRLESVQDSYIQERVEDIRDLRNRLLGKLADRPERDGTMSDRIVLSRGIPPSLVVEAKAEGARGMITERGGPTSHGMLLARSMGIPAITGISDMDLHIRQGDTVILDALDGRVIVSPSEATLAAHQQAMAQLAVELEANLRFRTLPAETRDGHSVTIQANVGVAVDLEVALRNGAKGVGLYRTEFPFMIREDLPSPEEQTRIYRRAYDVFPDGPIHFRLLDLGGDKFLPHKTLGADRNPFRGYRSIRVLLQNPEVLDAQVQAFARAADGRPLSILIPMVTSMAELRKAVQHIRTAASRVDRAPDPLRVGVMIEVPSAVELAAEMAREVDFVSIGTNDLIQYTLAVDRENAPPGTIANEYSPAILRSIRRVVQAGHAEHRSVSICGEMAGDWRLALLLAAMGVDALSVTPGAIPELKRRFSLWSLGDLRRHVDRILSISDDLEIRAEIERLLPAGKSSK